MCRSRDALAVGPSALLLSLLIQALAAAPALAEESPPATLAEAQAEPEEKSVADDSTHLETPPFPGVRTLDALRLHFSTRFLPEADVGPGHVSLYRPELRGRLTLPLSERAVLRLSALGSLGHYEFRGADAFRFAGVPLIRDSIALYRTRLSLEGAYRLNHEGQWLFNEVETWSLLGNLSGSSEFESGAFDEGISGGGTVAVGYEYDSNLRVSGGVSLQTSVEDGGLDVSPFASFRWNASEALTLRNRGFGIQLEYRLTPTIELFASGFRATDEYRLRDAGPGLDDLSFRDRQYLVGAGFEWKLSRHVRINTEAGVVVSRRIKVQSDDFGTLVSHRGDPSAYLEIRLEIRP